MTDNSERPLVIFHSPCLDGFTAAWACWLRHPDAEFVLGVYGQEPPDCAGRDVYLLDFSYKLPVMKMIIKAAKSVVVLDHHASAEKDLSNLWSASRCTDDVTCIFAMEKSGARLAWEWFHPGVEVPLFVRLVEDYDLWRFTLPNSKVLNAVFFSYTYDFVKWCELREHCEVDTYRAYLMAEGAAILRKHMKDVRELVGKLRQMRAFERVWDLHPYLVPVANLPYTMASDATELMAEDAPFAATYYEDAAGQLVFRVSSCEGGADVSEVAVRYGGGGHRHAAGFRVKSLEEL